MRTTEYGRVTSQLRGVSGALIVVLATACDNTVRESPSDDVTGPSAVSSVSPSGALARGRLVGIDSVLAELADSVPGFGGYYYGADGRAVIVLAGAAATSPDASLSRLRTLIKERRFATSAVRTRVAQYTFRQLADWKQALTLEVASATRAFVFADADESANRVVIGVTSAEAGLVVGDALRRLGVPAEAVTVVQTLRPRVSQSLTSSLRPTYGGLGVSINAQGSPTCTLGYNVRVMGSNGPSPEVYGLTNSHCTATTGGVEGTVFNQSRAPSRVGVESHDPLWITTGCPVGFVCRYSDAALFRYTTASDARPGFLQRPSGGPNGGSLTLDPSDPLIEITNEHWEPTTGDSTSSPQNPTYQFHKIGKNSGWTAGYKNSSCIDVQQGTPSGGATGRILWCQHVVRAFADSGDSGSPVFNIDNAFDVPSQWKARARGILWGSLIDPGGPIEYYFSDLYDISLDFPIQLCYACR